MTQSRIPLTAVAVAVLLGLSACHGNQPQPTAKLEPSLTPAELADRTLNRRAVEAVIWGTPAVNFDRMYQAMVTDAKAGEGSNKIVYWSRLFDWKNQTLTPNPDSIYFMPFFNTKDVGPVVLEIPPADGGSITGSVDDCWQTAIEDVGPAGLDKGKGGKYLILPPGYKGKVPAAYIPLQAYTYEGYALLRSILKSGSDADLAKAVAYGKQIKLYPLSQATHPPATQFVDAIDVVYDAILPWDMRYFESLNRIVQIEPWQTRDKAMIDQLRSIGIEKGKPFSPDTKTQEQLKEAVREAHAWVVDKYDHSFFPPPYYEGGRWSVPASPDVFQGMATFFADPDSYPVDDRGVAYTMAFFSPKHLGAGQFYLMTFTDKEGQGLEGANNYRLTVPANAPVTQYWSATAYDRDTHGLIRNVQWPSRSSQTLGLQKNGDGSVDLYFGPKAPARKESNWVPTSPNGKYEVLFRLYGPEKTLMEKTWKLPDIEKIQ
ncbi:MAG: DUF1254 domain-containing protein [Candidatus Acidiferrales bacterium]